MSIELTLKEAYALGRLLKDLVNVSSEVKDQFLWGASKEDLEISTMSILERLSKKLEDHFSNKLDTL